MLIQHWFREVCPVWSVFDSDVNYNRTVAQGTWGSSEPVFLALQAMSAAFLQRTSPELVEASSSLAEEAATIVRNKTQAVLAGGATSSRVTHDLVFAVFVLGTASQWSREARSENPWLATARELLSAWPLHFSGADHLYHSYFSQAFTYWESLSTLMSPHLNSANLSRRRARHRIHLHAALGLPHTQEADVLPNALAYTSLGGTRPNSWGGISCEVISILAETIALCRSASQFRSSKPSLDLESTSNAMINVAIRHEIESELRAMDFEAIVFMEEALGFSAHTWDEQTPLEHLVQTAEAYRQAALIQLQLCFDDSGPCPSERSVLTQALDLIAALERIPVESGSTSIHPVLYLSAAAALGRDTLTSATTDLSDLEVADPRNGDELDLLPLDFDVALLHDHFHEHQHQYGLPLQDDHCNQQHETTQLPHSRMMNVHQARQLISARLVQIQQAKPMRVKSELLQLIQSIWQEYDGLHTGSHSVNWLDVWSKSGLERILS